MVQSPFVFDTYAIMEILSDNPRYQPYLQEGIVINDFIFAEVAYKLFQLLPLNQATEALHDISTSCIRATPEMIQDAMRLRIAWKKREVSMTDCIGYTMAKHLGIKFLTGDKQFRGEPQVEFVT